MRSPCVFGFECRRRDRLGIHQIAVGFRHAVLETGAIVELAEEHPRRHGVPPHSGVGIPIEVETSRGGGFSESVERVQVADPLRGAELGKPFVGFLEVEP
jgi:hypothetical protein